MPTPRRRMHFAPKLAAERVVAASGLPWTTLRAIQFHDPILTAVRQMARLPVIPSPATGRRTWEEFLAQRVTTTV